MGILLNAESCWEGGRQCCWAQERVRNNDSKVTPNSNKGERKVEKGRRERK